ncbi:type 1 fimbrial protein [Escherichia coli]|nr:type 1 fimbrial protein [Escherichia coli]
MFLVRWAFIFLMFSVRNTGAATEPLNISAIIEAPTCELSVKSGASGGQIDLGDVDITELQWTDIAKNAGKDFVLFLNNCKGAGWGGLRPTLKITGNQDDIGSGLFRTGAKSDAKNIGVLLNYGSKAGTGLSGKVDSVPFHWDFAAGLSDDSNRVPDAQELNFWVTLARSGNFSSIRPGTVAADLNFSFEWH